MNGAAPSPVVLLVEDEMFVRMTTLDMLEEAGCTVLDAPTGAEAQALLEGAHIDLLVSDVGLPDTTGQDFYAACLARFPGLPVIFITGYGAGDLEAELTGNPLVTVLGKPFQSRSLASAVARALERARAARI
ncbi:response regulator [Camelimonas lactis]|nr:response regulator [Camelimonas lactis]